MEEKEEETKRRNGRKKRRCCFFSCYISEWTQVWEWKEKVFFISSFSSLMMMLEMRWWLAKVILSSFSIPFFLPFSLFPPVSLHLFLFLYFFLCFSMEDKNTRRGSKWKKRERKRGLNWIHLTDFTHFFKLFLSLSLLLSFSFFPFLSFIYSSCTESPLFLLILFLVQTSFLLETSSFWSECT